MLRPRAGGAPGAGGRALHLFALCSVAFAQPAFEEVNGTFFLLFDATRADLVAITLVLLIGPPAILLLAELIAGLVRPRLGEGLHLFFIGALAAIAVSEALDRIGAPGGVQIAVAALAGGMLALAYASRRPVRSFVSVLAAAPLLFAGSFLLTPPISSLALGSEGDIRIHSPSARSPVVMIVLDEFNTTALMDSRGRIDSRRYPNFARLASRATWYRNATTVHGFTDSAVPAILSGLRSSPDTIPSASDHPDNLFTLLGGSYRMQVFEPNTDLCPDRLCPESDRPPRRRRLKDMVYDMSLLSLSSTLPDVLADKLPGLRSPPVLSVALSALQKTMRRGEPATLHFAHLSLPHIPYLGLPSGKVYPTYVQDQLPLRDSRHWSEDSWRVKQVFQRYLLQVGYTDWVLGRVMSRMRATGLWDRALLVVTADHGVAHRAGGERREPAPENLSEIMPVPLFVKAPGQRRGRAVDAHVETIDVLPTIADLLGIRVPWRTDGRSAAGAAPPDRRSLIVENEDGDDFRIAARRLDSERAAALRYQVRLFGQRNREGLFRVGMPTDLRARPLADLTVAPARGLSARIVEPPSLRYDPRAEVVPARLVGQVAGSRATAGRRLVVSVNRRLEAATSTYSSGGSVWFSAMLPDYALRRGPNTVAVFALAGAPGHRRLESLAR